MGSDEIKLEKNVSVLVWIDQNINSNENIYYQNEIKLKKNIDEYFAFESSSKAIDFLKKIEFNKTYIICSGKMYIDFIKKYKEDINDFMICPKIIIFTFNKDAYLEMNKDNNALSLNHPFFNSGGVQETFEKVEDFIYKRNKIIDNCKEEEHCINDFSEVYNFERVSNRNQLIIPIFISYYTKKPTENDIKKFNEYMLKNYYNSTDLVYLFEQLNGVENIPNEIISKFWARAYTVQSGFYKDMNYDLKQDNIDKYLTYIQMMYEGVKIHSFFYNTSERLYRGAEFSEKEIKELQDFINSKKEGLPAAIIYSKSFLSFSLDKKEAINFMEDKKNKTLLIIEKFKEKTRYCTGCADIHNFSLFKNEKEVLVFPFSSFEILNIENDKDNDGKKYNIIHLNYLGKYEVLFKDEDPKELITQIPEDSILTKQFFNTNIVKKSFKKIYKEKNNSSAFQNLHTFPDEDDDEDVDN